jgi:hypothetical protein
VPESTDNNKVIISGLNKLLEANDRLDAALDATVRVWPVTPQCWIDKISEPTPLLEKHRIRNDTKLGF